METQRLAMLLEAILDTQRKRVEIAEAARVELSRIRIQLDALVREYVEGKSR